MIELKIDPEFKALIPPLTQEEREALRCDIARYGCRDALVTWNGTLVDGHNRYEICTQGGFPFKTSEMHFKDRTHVKFWMIQTQLGRRNLTEEQKSYLRGKRYEAEKQAPHRPEKGAQSEHLKTAGKLAKEYKVGQATIRRDAEYANAVDAIAETAGEEARNAILKRDSGLTKQDVAALAVADEETQIAVISSAEERAAWKRQELEKRKADKDLVTKLQDDLVRSEKAEEFAAFLLERIREDDIPQFISYSDAVPKAELHKAIRRQLQEGRTGEVVKFPSAQ